MNRRPVNRCAEDGCPMLGHWPPGGRCPLHEIDASTKE